MAKIFIENSDYKIVKIEQDIYVTKDGVIKAIDTELKKLRLDEMQSITEQEYYQEPVAWQGLTDDEIKEFMGNCWESPYHLIKVIEQELKTKNGFSDVKEKNHDSSY